MLNITLEKANHLMYTCFAMMLFVFAWPKDGSPNSIHLGLYYELKTSSKKTPTQRKKPKKRTGMTLNQREDNIQSPWKILEEQPICSLQKILIRLKQNKDVFSHNILKNSVKQRQTFFLQQAKQQRGLHVNFRLIACSHFQSMLNHQP